MTSPLGTSAVEAAGSDVDSMARELRATSCLTTEPRKKSTAPPATPLPNDSCCFSRGPEALRHCLATVLPMTNNSAPSLA